MRTPVYAFLAIILTFSTLPAHADWATSSGSCYAKGDIHLSAGLTLSRLGGYAMFDIAVHDAISVGGGAGYYSYSYSRYWRYAYLPMTARVLFHPFNLSVLEDKIKIRDQFDLYVGLATGWRLGWAKQRNLSTVINSQSSIGGFMLRENLGIRYFPSDNFYLFAETGAGFGWMSGGIGFRIN